MSVACLSHLVRKAPITTAGAQNHQLGTSAELLHFTKEENRPFGKPAQYQKALRWSPKPQNIGPGKPVSALWGEKSLQRTLGLLTQTEISDNKRIETLFNGLAILNNSSAIQARRAGHWSSVFSQEVRESAPCSLVHL